MRELAGIASDQARNTDLREKGSHVRFDPHGYDPADCVSGGDRPLEGAVRVVVHRLPGEAGEEKISRFTPLPHVVARSPSAFLEVGYKKGRIG
jgi:hypothetical protein